MPHAPPAYQTLLGAEQRLLGRFDWQEVRQALDIVARDQACDREEVQGILEGTNPCPTERRRAILEGMHNALTDDDIATQEVRAIVRRTLNKLK